MILTDGTTIYTNNFEDINESIIANSNTAITIGGIVKQQSDSQRLQIDVSLVIAQSEYVTLNSIITNNSAIITYTPSRILMSKTSIAGLTVIIKKQPQIKKRAWNGTEIVFYVDISFEEVI